MSNPICDSPQYLMNLDNIWYGSPGREGFRAPLFVHNGHPAIMSPGDKIARCFIPQDVVILNVPGEYLQINNTIVSITPLINALNPITGSGVPTQSPTGYGSKSSVYYDMTGKITYVWNGTQWIPMCGCSGTGTTPTVPVTPTCAISVLPTSVLNSSLRQGDPVNLSVQVTGTVATATATVSNGALPSGLSVSYLANGTSGTVVISGTPSVSGSFTAAIKVGVTGCETTIPVALTVAAASGGGGGTPAPNPTPTTPCTLDAGGDWMLSTVPNVAVNATRNLTGKIPATASLIKLSGDLEAGFNLTWSYPTLTVSGQAANLSNGKFAVYRFTDSATGCTKDFQVRVDVQAAACNLSVSPNILNIVAIQGTAIPTQNVSLANTPSGTTTVLESGALPSGLSLSLVAGQVIVTGTPTAVGTFSANYYVGTVECWKSLTVKTTVTAAQASCTIATDKSAIADATLRVGVPMTPQQFTLTGIPVGYEVTSIGNFPPGLSITPQALSNTSILFTVSGTPTTAGTYNSRARVGTASCATEVAFGFVVSTPTSVPTPTPTTPCTIATDKNAIADATLQVGVRMAPQQFTLTGIPTGYEVTAIGTMPPGLDITPQVLSNTSIRFTVSGTPTTAGTYNARARVGTASCATEVAFGFIVSTPANVPTTPTTPTVPTGGGGGGGGTPTGGGCNIVATPVNTSPSGTVGTALSF